MGKSSKVGAASRSAGARASSGAEFTGHESLSPQQFRAVRAYQEEGYHHSLNEFLRGQRTEVRAEVRATVAHLDSAIAGSRINRPMTLYRGFTMEGRPPSASDLVGMKVTDPAYYSTSTRREIAEGFSGSLGQGVVMRIKVPAGTKGLAVHKVRTGSEFSEGGATPEFEVLLPRGSSFRITSARMTRRGKIVATAEIVR